jgi:hypothetical protein
MDKDTALRLALEALEWEWGDDPPELQKAAITAVKAALEAKDEPVKLRRGDILRCNESDELCTVWATSTSGKTLVKWKDNDFGNYTAEQIGELFWLEPKAKDEPAYKALWQQMCERCDELDKKLAHLEAKDEPWTPNDTAYRPNGLPQDFIKHEVKSPEDWSEWVCPNPDEYFMKCCDCGLVHEVQYRVARYGEGDYCELVEDKDVQAQFRMRRRTTLQQEKNDEKPWVCECGADSYNACKCVFKAALEAKDEPLAYLEPTASPDNACYNPPQRKPLTDEQAMDAYFETPPFGTYKEAFIAGIRFIEAAHGIKGEA